MTDHVHSASDARTANNAVRHTYRVLSDAEKAQMLAVKDKGAEFLTLIEALRTPPEPAGEINGVEMFTCTFDPDLDEARKKMQEAVFWAVHHITG